VSPPLLVAVMGPTASGKTALAEAIADRLGAQLVSADAFQVYRGFDIGTAKPADRGRYRLLDILDPRETYGVGAFVRDAAGAAAEAHAQGRSVVVVGGTGLYIRALFDGYDRLMPAPDPELRAWLEGKEAAEPGSLARMLLEREPGTQADLRNPVRVRRALERLLDPRPPMQVGLPPFRRFKLAILPERGPLLAAIAERTRAMVSAGWADEVRDILAAGVPVSAPAFRAIGYQCFARLALGETSEQEAVGETVQATSQYAKRQATWLRSERSLEVLQTGSPLDRETAGAFADLWVAAASSAE
jgi:tRNA dimethylallyltransferase